MKLYNYWRSTSSWRVRIALAYKHLSYTYVPVNLLTKEQASDEFVAVNPMGQVPVLEWDDGAQRRRLSQSLAILELLEERHPTPPLLPGDAYARGQARMIAEMVNAGIQPLQNLHVALYVEQRFEEDRTKWCAYWIEEGLAALEAAVCKTAGEFAVGHAVSLADCCIVPQLYSARRNGVDLLPYRTLARIEAACQQLPAFHAAHPDRQPDAKKA